MQKYKDLNDSDKYDLINKMYNIENKSFIDIAKIYETYPNKIRRDAIKLGIKIRDKSEAQKNALLNGNHKHPTKGKVRDIKTKEKIGQSVLKAWSNITLDELNNRKQKAKDNWNNLSNDDKENMHNKAIEAIRKASKQGSKLEKFLLECLINDNYKVAFHQEQMLVNTKLQIDMVIPSLNLAIEVDGPSHFLPVWGEDALNKNKKYDNKKDGLIIGKGLKLIRIQQTMDFSKSRGILVYEKIKNIIPQIENDNISTNIFYINDQ